MRTKIIFVLLILQTTESSILDLKCVREIYTFKESLKPLSCIVKDPIPRFDIYENVTISGGKSEIIGFSVVNNTMSYIPYNFGDIFLKLKALQIKNSSLEEILPENFNKLKDLEYLDLSMNHIQYLNAGLFEHNSKLVTINLRENKINAIDPAFASNLKNFEIDLEGNMCISGKYQQKSWDLANPTINGTCWSTMKKLEMNVIKNSSIVQKMKRSIDSLKMKNSFAQDSKAIETENKQIIESNSNLIKNDCGSKFTNSKNDLWNNLDLKFNTLKNDLSSIMSLDMKKLDSLSNLKQVIIDSCNAIGNKIQISFNEVKSKLLQESQKNTNEKNDKFTKQIDLLERKIDDSLLKMNNLLNTLFKNLSNKTNYESKNSEIIENKIEIFQIKNDWNLMINIINTALLSLLISLVIIFQFCKSNTKSSQDPQYDKIKKVPSRANSTIKSQRDLSVHPLSIDTLRRDNPQNIADHDYFGMTQHNAYNDADHKSHNSNLGHSDTVYECTHWDESKLPYLDSEINENVAVEDNYEGLYSEIPSQINAVVTEDKKDDSQIYAVITKN